MWFIWIMWVIVAIAIIATIILLTGKGSMLVSGFNTKSPEERAKYDKEKVSKQTGLLTLLSVSSRTAGAPRCFSLKSGAITTPPQCKRGCLRAMTYRQADTPLPSRSERSERRRQ